MSEIRIIEVTPMDMLSLNIIVLFTDILNAGVINFFIGLIEKHLL